MDIDPRIIYSPFECWLLKLENWMISLIHVDTSTPIIIAAVLLYVLPIILLLQFKSSKTKNSISNDKLARSILQCNHISIQVCPGGMFRGILGSGYDSANKQVLLGGNPGDSDILSVAIAAHEACHAIQDHKKYKYMIKYAYYESRAFWSILVAIASILIGLYIPLFISSIVLEVALIAFGVATIVYGSYCRLMILIAEINASTRAYRLMKRSGVLTSSELHQLIVIYVLMALTYVAALLAVYCIVVIVIYIVVSSADKSAHKDGDKK